MENRWVQTENPEVKPPEGFRIGLPGAAERLLGGKKSRRIYPEQTGFVDYVVTGNLQQISFYHGDIVGAEDKDAKVRVAQIRH